MSSKYKEHGTLGPYAQTCNSTIIKTELFPNRVPYTIYQALNSIWKTPGRAIVEIREGEFQFIDISEEYVIRDIAYMTVVLSVFRNFPYLGYDGPRKEKRERALRGLPDAMFQYQFLKRVQLVGYDNGRIAQKLNDRQQHLVI